MSFTTMVATVSTKLHFPLFEVFLMTETELAYWYAEALACPA